MHTVPNATMINRHAFTSKPSFAGEALAVLQLWRERSRQRRALGALDERALHDIGLSRASAVGEAEKPFWRP